jgi:DNA-binding PadR family transcriptional regulator
MKKTYEQQLLQNWEEIFRQGLLTFWVFVAIRVNQLSVAQIQQEVKELTNGTYSPADQTIYRLLRKNYDLELVDYNEVSSSNGPNRKLYSLSRLGHTLLTDFTNRNIKLFAQRAIKDIYKGEK